MINKLKKNYFLLIMTFLVIYFFFNLLEGNRGLISYFEKKEIYNLLQTDQKDLSDKVVNLEHKNSLLKENIDSMVMYYIYLVSEVIMKISLWHWESFSL